MVRFGLMINPHSRRMRRRKGLSTLLGLADQYAIPVAFPEEDRGACVESYQRSLAQLLDKGVDVLLVCSGDGGHHLMDTALFSLMKEEDMPLQANIRGGTMNIRAESAGLSRRTLPEMLRYSSYAHLLRKFAESYSEVSIQNVPFVERKLLHIHADEKELYGFAYSSGFVVPFFERYYALGGYHLDAFKIIAEAMVGLHFPQSSVHRMFDPIAVAVSLDQEGLCAGEGYKGILVLAQDVRMDFGPVSFCAAQFEGINNSGKARFLATQKASLGNMLAQLPLVFIPKGGELGRFSLPDLIERDVDYLSIRGRHGFLVDGDLYTAQDFVSVTLTKALRYAVV